MDVNGFLVRGVSNYSGTGTDIVGAFRLLEAPGYPISVVLIAYYTLALAPEETGRDYTFELSLRLPNGAIAELTTLPIHYERQKPEDGVAVQELVMEAPSNLKLHKGGQYQVQLWCNGVLLKVLELEVRP